MDQMIKQCTEMMNGMMNGMMGSMTGANMTNGGMMGEMMGGNMMGGMILFWLLAVVAIALLVMLVWSRTTTNNLVAVNILQERFARGEIDREEYQGRRSILRQRR